MANLRTNNLSGEQGQKAYKGSLYFNGPASADFLTLASSSDFDFSTGDVTVEAWVFMSSHPTHSHIFSTQNFDLKVSNGQIRLFTTSGQTDTTRTVTVGHWHHIAAVRSASINSGNWVVYLNGVGVNNSLGSVTSGDSVAEVAGRVRSSDEEFHGYISNLRVVNGTAVYTGDFEPPTSELTIVPNTVLLCCQDSNNPLQEATGKTLTPFGNHQEVDDTELVTNSGFTNDISGWTASGIQWSHSGGALMHFGNGSTQRNIYQDVTTVIGKKYVARVLASSAEADTAYWQVGPTDATVTINYVADNNNSAQIPYQHFFTATSTTTRIRFYSYDSSNSSNVRSYWYLASIKLAEQPKQTEVIPPYGVDAGNTFGGSIQQSTEGHMYFPTGRTEERGRGRAIWGGGQNPSNKVVMDYFQIQTGGITFDFGNLTDARNEVRACGSSTRGVWAGGRDPGLSNIIDFVEIPTTANAVDFGNLTVARAAVAAVSNSTRGCFMAGFAPSNTNHIDFITIASLGDATDFGDMLGTYQAQGRAMSPTRGLAAGNYGASNLIEFITIASTGNSTDFGDRTVAAYSLSGTSDNTRGVFTGGDGPTTNVIDFVTMASAGNATDFGDLITANGSSHADTSDSIIGCIAGGQSNTNTIEKITIQTTGNAVDYGDLTSGRSQLGATSDSHGGLS